MRKLFYLLIAMLVLMSCGNGSKKKNEENKAEEIQPNRIVSIRPRACFSPSYNKVKSQTKHVWLLTLL